MIIAIRRVTVADAFQVMLRARHGGDGGIEIEVEGPEDLTVTEQRALTMAVGRWRRELQGEVAEGQCWVDGCRARTSNIVCAEHAAWTGFSMAARRSRSRAVQRCT